MRMRLTDAHIEERAFDLLNIGQEAWGAPVTPPIPVERIAEDLLDLRILWDDLPEALGESVIAALEPARRTIVFNEARQALLEETPWLYHTVLAHEIGHWVLHVAPATPGQEALPGLAPPDGCVYLGSGPGSSPHETEANRYMGYLLMPHAAIIAEVQQADLTDWPTLYRLRDHFQVTITALRIRLERLGLLYVASDGQLYPSLQEYRGQLRLHR